MREWLCAATLILGTLAGTSFAAGVRALPPPAEDVGAHSCSKCGQETYGTAVRWVGDPSSAAAQALKEQKLVFVLHVSGHFEDPGFT